MLETSVQNKTWCNDVVVHCIQLALLFQMNDKMDSNLWYTSVKRLDDSNWKWKWIELNSKTQWKHMCFVKIVPSQLMINSLMRNIHHLPNFVLFIYTHKHNASICKIHTMDINKMVIIVMISLSFIAFLCCVFKVKISHTFGTVCVLLSDFTLLSPRYA